MIAACTGDKPAGDRDIHEVLILIKLPAASAAVRSKNRRLAPNFARWRRRDNAQRNAGRKYSPIKTPISARVAQGIRCPAAVRPRRRLELECYGGARTQTERQGFPAIAQHSIPLKLPLNLRPHDVHCQWLRITLMQRSCWHLRFVHIVCCRHANSNNKCGRGGEMVHCGAAEPGVWTIAGVVTASVLRRQALSAELRVTLLGTGTRRRPRQLQRVTLVFEAGSERFDFRLGSGLTISPFQKRKIPLGRSRRILYQHTAFGHVVGRPETVAGGWIGTPGVAQQIADGALRPKGTVCDDRISLQGHFRGHSYPHRRRGTNFALPVLRLRPKIMRPRCLRRATVSG